MLSPLVLKPQALVEKLGHLLPEILPALPVIVPSWVGEKAWIRQHGSPLSLETPAPSMGAPAVGSAFTVAIALLPSRTRNI